MHYALCLAVVLLSFTLHAADVPIPHTGTPRVFTEKEKALIDKYLGGVHNHNAQRFGEQMGFGPIRMIPFEPLTLFHWLGNEHKREIETGFFARSRPTPQIELLGRIDQNTPIVYKNPLPLAKDEEHLRKESFELVNGKPRKVTPPVAGQLKNIETRELLPSEMTALKKLQAGESLYWEQTGDDIRAVGALIAKKDCAECHATKENALLGALTYRFSTDLILKQIRMIEEYEAKDAELRKNRLK